MFPTWPAKSEQQRVKRGTSPRPPEGGLGYSQLVRTLGSTFSMTYIYQALWALSVLNRLQTHRPLLWVWVFPPCVFHDEHLFSLECFQHRSCPPRSSRLTQFVCWYLANKVKHFRQYTVILVVCPTCFYCKVGKRLGNKETVKYDGDPGKYLIVL